MQRLPLKTVLVEGNRIAYLDSGNGPPVILVHGFSASMWHWEYQQTALSTSHRVLTLDLLGSGLSEKPDILYTPNQFVDFFSKFMDALGIKRASLVGNSMGAGLVIGMALVHPDRVNRMVLISGLPTQIRVKLASPVIKYALDSRLPAWLVNLGNKLSGRRPTRIFLSELVHNSGFLTEAVIERSYLNRKRPGTMGPLLAIEKNLALWEDGLARRLGEIRHPTLILWGAEDRVFPPQVGHDLHATIASSTFIAIPDAGHMPQWERPEVVNPMLIQFLNS